MIILTEGLSLFIAENLILSHNRELLLSKSSEKIYQAIYSTFSLAACGGEAYGYFRYGRGGKRLSGGLFPLQSRPLRIAAVAVQAAGFAGLMSSLPKLQIPFTFLPTVKNETTEDKISTTESSNEAGSTPPASPSYSLKMLCPVDFKSNTGKQQGLQRITRYPELWSLALAAGGSAVLTPIIAESILFAFPTVFAIIGMLIF